MNYTISTAQSSFLIRLAKFMSVVTERTHTIYLRLWLLANAEKQFTHIFVFHIALQTELRLFTGCLRKRRPARKQYSQK